MKTQNQANRMPVMLFTAILTLTCLLAVRPAAAATDTWNGGAVPDGNWMNPGNWNGVTPATNDLLVFTGGTQTKTTNNYTTGFPFNNISFSSGASPFTVTGNSMVLSSPTDAGSGQIAGGSISSASAYTNTIFLPIVLANGKHTISGGSGNGYLNLNGAITQGNGSVAVMSGNINVTGGLSTNGAANGILGGWAIFNNNWATLDTHSNVIAYTGYTVVNAGSTIADNAAANVQIPVAGANVSTTAGTTHINSLLFGSSTASGANETLAVGAGNTLVLGQNGGIYNNTGVAGAGTIRTLIIGTSVAAGGILTAGDGIHPATITLGAAAIPSTASMYTINSVITDNGSAPVTVVQAGAYAQWNGGGATATVNTYSGGTYILQGRSSQPGSHTFGTGPVYVVPGGQFNTGCPITNDIYIAGSGTVENNGMGAVRMYVAAVASGNIGNLSGTVHLTGNAAFGANNTAFSAAGAPFIGISGQISGPGGLMISSPTATQSGAGTINIGSTNGTTDIPNNYAGDTTINGTANGSAGSVYNTTLRIANPADNNIMPHGTNGSYLAGNTGNLILNGNFNGSINRQAIFDLNGSTQTVNGLISTAIYPANNLVVDSSAGGNGTLVVGDSGATSVFAGSIQNSVFVTKIGRGILTLSGANTYTGNTTINGGTLVTTTASTGTGNFIVSNSAALGVTVASAGSTLQANNLTFGTSGSSLQLNAGSFGDPGAPVVNVNGTLAMNGNVNISLSGVGLTAGGPIPLLNYNPGTRTGAGSFVLANSPRVVGVLSDDLAGHVTITITSADAGIKWEGGVSGNWDTNDTGNTIWKTFPSGSTTYYIESGSGNDVAQFDDSATGTTNVNLTTTLTPQSITVSNFNDNYLFYGPGSLTGASGLTKYGTGTLTIANTGNNNFSGPIALNAGTLVISNTSSIGNTITGTGALTKNGNGTLTLSGDGSGYSGPVTVNGGILSVLYTISLATASQINVANGATLDIANNNVALAQEPVTISGSGVGGNGAIINSSGYGGNAVATSFQNVTMTGDTTIGGPGRLDFRSSDPVNGADGVLNTGGNAYNLTKTSGNTLQLSSVQIDSGLGNINVQQGLLSFQGNMSSLGNPADTLTVFSGATAQFNSINSSINKALVLQDSAVVNNSGGANTYDSPVTLLGNGVFNIGAGTSLTFTNVISGAGSLSMVNGTGSLTLGASNTYSGSTLIGVGALYLTEPGDIRNSSAITVATGTTLDVTGRNDQTLTVLGGHSLTGSGTLNGNLTNLPASTMAVGSPAATGTFTVNQTATLNGTTTMKVVETNLTSDVLNLGSTMQFGGTLNVVNLAGTPYVPGDSFTLFTSGGFNGSFSSINPATPGYNLAWDTNTLAMTGVLNVTGPGPNTAPTNIVTSFDGSNLTLSWPMDHTGWQLQVQTNSLTTGLGANWSNVANSYTTNQVTLPVSTANGAVFYRMVYP